jgi:hypothetical protein
MKDKKQTFNISARYEKSYEETGWFMVEAQYPGLVRVRLTMSDAVELLGNLLPWILSNTKWEDDND